MSEPQTGHFTPSNISGSFLEKSKLTDAFPSSSFSSTNATEKRFLDFEIKPESTSVCPFVRSSTTSSSAKSLPAMVPMENLQPLPSFL